MSSSEPTPMEILIEQMKHLVRERKHEKSEPMPVPAPASAENPQFPTVYVPPVKPVDTPTQLAIAPNVRPEVQPNLHPLSGTH